MPEQLTADNVMSFIEANNIENGAELIESLPPLHKRHVSLVFVSRALNKEFVSKTHPRVVSWGADARFILSWASNPAAPDNIEFLQHGSEQWEAGVIDFSGDEPEMSNPEVCSTCHGHMKRPIWGNYKAWRGTNDDEDLEQSEWLQILSDLEASNNPRISPLELYEKRVYPLVLSSSATGTMDSIFRFAAEFASMLSLRHAQVLFNRLKKRDNYAELAEQTVCGQFIRVTDLFPVEDHFLGIMHSGDQLIVVQEDSDDIDIENIRGRTFHSGNANLDTSLKFLILHDIWSRDNRVFDFYARLGNEQVSQRCMSCLNYLPGTATAEQELRASYRPHFELMGQASLDPRVDREIGRGYKSAVFGQGHLDFMAPRVCNIVRQAPNQRLSQVGISDGKAGEDAGEIAFTVTVDPVRSDPVSVGWFTDPSAPMWNVPIEFAEQGVDYPYSRGSLIFNPGEARRNITVEIIDDDIAEPPEYFSVHLERASGNALIVDGVALANISGELPPDQAEGPTARFENTPLAHDGLAAFTVQLQFSEEVALDDAAFTNGLLKVWGGAVEQVSRVTADSNIAWEFSVTPDGNGDVDIRLPATKYGACAEQLAVCTSDGRRLWQATTVTVRGPVAPPASVTPPPVPPVATIAAGTSTVTEGTAATFTVSLDKAAEEALSVPVTVTQEGAVFSDASSALVSFAVGERTQTLTLATNDDAVIESNGAVTVALGRGSGYTLGAADSAEVTVEDNDSATWRVSAADSTIDEGGSTVVKIEIINGKTFSETQSIAVSVTGTAAASDYELTADPLTLDSGASSVSATLTAAADAAEESAETVVVSAAHDGSSLGSVTVTIRANEAPPLAVAAAWGERIPDRDIELPSGSSPTGLWSDGETLWVISDSSMGEVTTYSLADGSAIGAGRVTLSNGMSASHRFYLQGGGFPAGLWSDGETLWVADMLARKVFAYRLSDGARQSDRDISDAVLAAAGNTTPAGLWSDGETLWVADILTEKVFAYRLSDRVRAAEKEFDLRTASGRTPLYPWGLWSDGETALVTLYYYGGVEGYALSGGAHKPDRGLGAAATGLYPMDLWSDGETLWVVSEGDSHIRAYAVPYLRPATTQDASSVADPFRVRVVTRVDAAPGGFDAGPPLFIADAALRKAIAGALGLASEEPVGANAMTRIRSLNVRGAGIATLTGLEHAVNLEALDLGHNALKDPWTLGLLPRLTVLNLDGAVSDLSFLASLVALEKLSLRNNGLTDVSALAGLVNLRHLSLRGNALSDVWPLAGLAQLEILDLRGNALLNQAPLTGLYNLRHLDLSNTVRVEP